MPLLVTSNLPRAKFLQLLLQSTVLICLGTAIGLLQTWSAVRARELTPSSPPEPGSSEPGYNSSASAVLGIWFFAQIYVANVVRAKFPQFTLPVITYSVFADCTASLSTRLPDVTSVVKFNTSLLELFLFGFAVSTAIHFLVLPTDMRSIIFRNFNAYFAQLNVTLDAQLGYLHSLEDPENVRRGIGRLEAVRQTRTPQAQAVKDALGALQGAHGKVQADVSFAKREFGIGYLGPEHLNEMCRLNRRTLLPMTGLGAVIDLFEQVHELTALIGSPVDGADPKESEDELRSRITGDWSDYMSHLHDTHTSYVETIKEGIEHVLLTLRLKRREKSNASEDIEANISSSDDSARDTGNAFPGTQNFAQYYEARVNQLHDNRKIVLRVWCKRKGIDLPEDFFDHPTTASYTMETKGDEKEQRLAYRRKQRELFMLFYLEYLLFAASMAVLRYMRFADDCRDRGVLSKRRIIYPGKKRMKKWIFSLFATNDTSDKEEYTDLRGTSRTSNPELIHNMRKDPEHLPPTNLFERIGEHVRVIPKFLRSPESSYGFRIACAVMSVAIVVYLHNTQQWFIRERGLWVLIIISITMNPTAGASLFGLVLRTAGTVLAMLASWCVWYIPDQKIPGILVFLWIFVSIFDYFLLKQPRLLSLGYVSEFALVILVGYEVEARKVGQAIATSNGQTYYPLYALAPRRLLNALIGVGVAFFWTIFPYPISEHSKIRKILGDSFCHLADYHTVVHELVRTRLGRNLESQQPKLEDTLEKCRTKIFSRLTTASMQSQILSRSLQFEVQIGGRFPKEKYAKIAASINS